jgi:hypothetical protein
MAFGEDDALEECVAKGKPSPHPEATELDLENDVCRYGCQ